MNANECRSVGCPSSISSSNHLAGVVLQSIRKKSQIFRSIINKGTTGSLSLVKCSWRSRDDMLIKLAIEKTLIDAEVSFRMLILRWVRWYSTVKVYQYVNRCDLCKLPSK